MGTKEGSQNFDTPLQRYRPARWEVGMSFNYYFFLTLTYGFSALTLASFIFNPIDPVMLIFNMILLGGAIGFGFAARAYIR
jgi:polyferredoxin